MEWNRKSTLNENVFTSIDLCINDGTSTIMFFHSTTNFLYQCLVSCMYNLGEVTPKFFNSLSKKSNSPKEVFLRHSTILRDTKLQELQFKLLYDILITNYWLKRFELSETDACTFCGIECESLLHLFWSCRYAADFWSEVAKWWFTKTGDIMSIAKDCIFVGNSNFTDLQNHILILATNCMYAARCNNRMPSVQLFVAKVYNTLNVEENISRENNTINKFIDKWESLI